MIQTTGWIHLPKKNNPESVKLESTLSDRAGFLYIAPLIDSIFLLLIFFLFSTNFVLKSGISVKLPQSNSAIPSALQSHIVSVAPGESEDIYFNEEKVDIARLEELLKTSTERSTRIILLADEKTSYGTVMKVSLLAFRYGYELSFATQEQATP